MKHVFPDVLYIQHAGDTEEPYLDLSLTLEEVMNSSDIIDGEPGARVAVYTLDRLIRVTKTETYKEKKLNE